MTATDDTTGAGSTPGHASSPIYFGDAVELADAIHYSDSPFSFIDEYDDHEALLSDVEELADEEVVEALKRLVEVQRVVDDASQLIAEWAETVPVR